MSDRAPQSCNRQPFLSDQECDRGSVDIHQFDDFPLCESIDPTQAEIPPEIVDTPINLPVPPACACFNIDYALKLKYNKKRLFAATADFSAKGDCCEGNYVSNFNLEIPCPVLGSGASRRIKMKIGYGNGKGSAEVSYLRANQDSCTIEAKNVDIDLNIPCPIQKKVDRKVKIGISYGQAFRGASAKVVEANAEKCELEILEPTFTLNIPCPVKKGGNKKIKIGISYGKDFKPASGSVIKTGDSCTIEANPVTFALQIPCPILGREGQNPKIRAKIGWCSKQRSVSASFINANPKECTIEPKDVNLDLQIPCPVKKEGGKKIKIGIAYGQQFRSASGSVIKATDNCTIEANPATFDLQIPCPVRKDGNRKIKIGIQYGQQFKSASASVINAGESCTIEANPATFNLQIPCPVRQEGNKKIKIGIGYGEKFKSASASVIKAGESCTIEANPATFDLQIPCPVKKEQKRVKLGVKWGEKSHISASLLTAGESCTIETNEATFNLEIACPLHHTTWHRQRIIDGRRWCYVMWRRRWIGDGWNGSYSSFSTSFIRINESSCLIETGRLDLDIKCPIKGGETGWKKFRIVKKWAGTTSNVSTSLLYVDKTNCQLQTKDLVSMNLDIPCPVSNKNLKIETLASTTSDSTGKFTVSSTYDEQTCLRTIKFKATCPKGGGIDMSSSTSFVRYIRYNVSKHAFQIRTQNFKSKVLSEWKDIVTATAHMDDHTCCNDK